MKAKPSTAQTVPLPASSSVGEKSGLVAQAPAKLSSNWLKTVFVTWINPLLKLGSRRPLDILDLCVVPECMVADPVTMKLCNSYEKKVKEDQKKATAAPSYLLNAMISVFGANFVLAGAFLLAELVYLMPITVLTDVVEFRRTSVVPFPYSVICDAGAFIWLGPLLMFFLQIFSTILLNTYFLAIRYLGIRVRTAVSGLIYRKSLRLSCAARQVRHLCNWRTFYSSFLFFVALFFW
jgi:hypothetical protein